MTLKKTLEMLVLSGAMAVGSAVLAADGGTGAAAGGATAAPAASKDAGSSAAATAGATAPAAISDAQIAAIVVTANQVDIDAGKLAKGKASHKDVKAFAALMITDHTSVNKSVNELAKKLKLKPEENDTSKALKTGGEENRTKLKALKGADFDKAYVDAEVDYHQRVLDAVDNTLIPNATNPDLKTLLEKVRPSFVAHLEHAKKLQASLGAGTSG